MARLSGISLQDRVPAADPAGPEVLRAGASCLGGVVRGRDQQDGDERIGEPASDPAVADGRGIGS